MTAETGVFQSRVDLQAGMNSFLAEAKDNRKPFVWITDLDKISVAGRGRYKTSESIHQVRK
jgi:hypothetical protein